jgi:hypothetical protein
MPRRTCTRHKTRRRSRYRTRTSRKTLRRARKQTRRGGRRTRTKRRSHKSHKSHKSLKSLKSRSQSKGNSTRRRSKPKKRIPRGKRCSDLLKEKIGYNIGEFKKGKFVSIKQAIAVAYKQVGAKYPSCKQVFTKKRKTQIKN